MDIKHLINAFVWRFVILPVFFVSLAYLPVSAMHKSICVSGGQDFCLDMPAHIPLVIARVPVRQQQEQLSEPDLDRLAIAVSYAETGGCADGTALKRRNCFGIMSWSKNGQRYPRYFKTQEESFAEFKRIWRNYYRRFPDMKLAMKWTGSDNTEHWLNIVRTIYTQKGGIL
jgi:hypothetical protein